MVFYKTNFPKMVSVKKKVGPKTVGQIVEFLARFLSYAHAHFSAFSTQMRPHS